MQTGSGLFYLAELALSLNSGLHKRRKFTMKNAVLSGLAPLRHAFSQFHQ